MISVIICSVKPERLSNISHNIHATIGVHYELIAVDNRNSGKGISRVYNEAAEIAKYEYLCFVHEDVIFHTKEWGRIIEKLFADNKVSLIGVSGSTYKSSVPGSWVACDKKYYRSNTLQHFDGDGVHQQQLNPFSEKFSDVSVIDGVFMVTRKSVWEKKRFDEHLLKGFHGYDLDFSLSIGLSDRVVVTHEILLEHFSPGSFSRSWLNDILTLHQKWHYFLPRNVTSPGKCDPYSDYIATISLLSHMLRYKGFVRLVITYYCKLLFKYFNFNRFRYTKSVLKYLFFHHTIQQFR